MNTSSTLAAGLLGLQSQFPANHDIQLGLVIFDEDGGLPSSAITSIQGSLSRNGAAPVDAVFLDDGLGHDAEADDGVFTANLSPGEPGEHRIFVTIEGHRNGHPFARSVGGLLRVAEPCGRFLAGFRSFSVDEDGNGLPERLDLETNVEVLRAGRFQLQAHILASNGESDFANAFTDLELGPQTVRVGFEADRLRDLGVEGPCQVTDLKLAYLGDQGLEICDTQIEVGETEAFDPSTAERAPIILAGPHRDSGVDLNGDGTLDRLDFQTDLSLLVAGEFGWDAGLYDSQGRQIDFASGSGFLSAGPASAALSFDGKRIAENGVDGPFHVRNFSIIGEAGTASFVLVGSTRAYSAGDFGATTGGTSPGGPAPSVSSGGVVNAASFVAVISPGSWVTIFGQNLAATTATWDGAFRGTDLPTVVAGVQVLFDGEPGAVSFVSPTQINVQAPNGVDGQVEVRVILNGVASPPRIAEVRASAPALFTFGPGQTRHAAAVHLDGVFVGPEGLFGGVVPTRPAQGGDRILVFGTGFGPTNPIVPAGRLFQGAARLTNPVRVLIGGREAVVEFAGLSGAGLNQFNVVVPDGLQSGNHEIVIEAGSQQTQPGVRLNVIGSAGEPGSGPIEIQLLKAELTIPEAGLLSYSWSAAFSDTRARSLRIDVVLSVDEQIGGADVVLLSENRETRQGQSGLGVQDVAIVPQNVPDGDYFIGILITDLGSGEESRSNVLPLEITR